MRIHEVDESFTVITGLDLNKVAIPCSTKMQNAFLHNHFLLDYITFLFRYQNGISIQFGSGVFVFVQHEYLLLDSCLKRYKLVAITNVCSLAKRCTKLIKHLRTKNNFLESNQISFESVQLFFKELLPLSISVFSIQQIVSSHSQLKALAWSITSNHFIN